MIFALYIRFKSSDYLEFWIYTAPNILKDSVKISAKSIKKQKKIYLKVLDIWHFRKFINLENLTILEKLSIWPFLKI